MNASLPAQLDPSDITELRACGLFLADWYLTNHPDVAGSGSDPLVHFLVQGCADGRRPNPYFDPSWYLAVNQDVRDARQNPLLHYLRYGEREGRWPVPYFDPVWYRAQHGLSEDAGALRHYLQMRNGGQVSPIPEFDAAWYTATYTDVGAERKDPFEHYLHQGFREDRNPSRAFDNRFYRDRYLGGGFETNPLLHYLEHRHLGTVLPRRPPAEPCMAASVRANVQPGPLFEPVRPLPAGAERRAMVLAYYLPQFHAIEENDRWWGRGFTEWMNVGRGLPRYDGHYQPRMPRDLGHYDLLAPGVMQRQIALARGAGLGGFVFYFYWFNGRRLLERPLEALLADPTLDFPFCLMWANENWTRRWDGSDDEVLVSQDYRAADEAALVACFARHYADPRYIRLQGRPLLMLYRAPLVPDAAATVARWRRLFRDGHGEDPIFVMAQSFTDSDPRPFGMDGAVEFPPHKLTAGLPLQNRTLAYFDADFAAQVFAYEDVVGASLAEPAPDFPLIKTAAPMWDNDARRQGQGLVLHGATPARYQAWLAGLVARAQRHRFFDTPLVCVNAWNEWAEGAYLEPDQHFGGAFLNATGRAVAGLDAGGHGRLLLVGHDAFPAGAQHLLLQLARQLRHGHGVDVAVLLLGGGRLEAAYGALAPTHVAAPGPEAAHRIALLREQGFASAIVNTAAAAPVVEELVAQGFDVTLLVHELPRILHERGLVDSVARAARAARRVVFPAAVVRQRFEDLAPVGARAVVLPQGVYKPVAFSPEARAARRAGLGVEGEAVLAIGVGYADLRKGFDLFLQSWRAAYRADPSAHFLWLGEIDAALHAHLAGEIAAAVATGRFHFPGAWSDDVAAWLSAADVFVLSSREDPLPSAVLEALAAGLPIVAFEGAGGIPDLLAQHAAGRAVPLGDAGAMAAAVASLASADPPERAARRSRLAAVAQTHFAFDRYAARLLRLARPELPSISVAVPSYNYGRYLGQRLASIFAQGTPVREVIVLDDASDDDSLAVARAAAADWDRAITIVPAERNSGSAFRQWRRAAELARGDWLWIAEADDACDPAFLETLVQAIAQAPDAVLAFCDSRSVDGEGNPVWPSYQDYYAQSGATALAQDGVFSAGAFLRRCLAERNLILNASAVLWRRDALLQALDALGAELETFRIAGDWRLYVELLAAASGSVAYVASPLNIHRRHAASATGRLDAASHLAEIARVHDAISRHCCDEPGLAARQQAYRAEVAAQPGFVSTAETT